MRLAKTLDPASDMQFNQVHPRAAGATGYYRPGQFVPKSQAEKQQEEAEDEVPDTSGDPEDPLESTVVQSGTSEQDAEVATEKKYAKQLRKSAEETPLLRVVFGDRADATKFALACEAILGDEVTLRVTPAANGQYHVEPDGLDALSIDALQEMIHARAPLETITPEAVAQRVADRLTNQEPQQEEIEPTAEPMAEGDTAAAVNQAAASGWEETARELIRQAVETGQVTETTLPEVLKIAQAIEKVSGTRDAGVLPVMEAVHYGSVAGLRAKTESDDPETAARARMLFDVVGLEKGNMSKRQLVLVPIRNEPLSDKTHDPADNDGKAQPLGTTERVTDAVGTEPSITEPTAKYPKTGKKPNRRPRLILKGID